MEPSLFFSQFDDILVRYRNGKVDLTSAKKDLLNLFERHSDDPTGKEIGFDLSHCDPSFKLILSEALEEFQSRFCDVGSIFAKFTSAMQKEMQQAADQGFVYKGQTVFDTTFGGKEVVVIMERDRDATIERHEYKLLATSKTSTMQKELTESGEPGFQYVGMTVAETAFGGKELVTILRRGSRR